MASPTPADGGDIHFSFDYLSREDFHSIFWDVLSTSGHLAPPQYMVQLYEEHRVPHCRVCLTLEPHHLQLGSCSLNSEMDRFQVDDTTEAATLWALMTLCGYHPLEMLMHPLRLFPAE